jgi:pilus assembly protein FimV
VRTALGLALALASGAASALGLGQIEVKSRIGQPFLAEIPIISSDPAELENLQAELASPLVFARVGLQPPMGVVAELQFTSALDAAGRPIIRVTSAQPVNEPLLTFLVSVDWGQGRLVREYAALVDAPRTVSAPMQPAIEETVVSEPNIIEREPEAAAPATAEAPPATTPEEEVGQAVAREENAAADNEIPAAPQPEPQAQIAVATPPRAPVPQVSRQLSGDYTVRRGDTLSEIAGRMEGQASLDQAMIALLRANPDAFIDGNINLLKAGAVLDLPPGDELASVDAGEARRLVAQHVQQWRDARRAVPQPALEGAAAASGAQPVGASGNNATAGGTATADARLEIVPPEAARAAQAGTQSGIQAGGEGQMLRQELQQTQETVAARDAEVQELKSRVAELEQLQKQQQQLIAMKDSELAAAQQRVAKTNEQAATQAGSPLPWILGGGALLLALLGGWWWGRRPAKPAFRAPAEPAAATPSIADAFAAGPDIQAYEEPETIVEPPAPEERAGKARAYEEPTFELTPEPQPPARPVTPPAPAAPIAPAWHIAAGNGNGRRAHVEPTLATQPGQERLELARAYIDLGDRESARQLLSEVVINGDLAARQAASRMLQDLG